MDPKYAYGIDPSQVTQKNFEYAVKLGIDQIIVTNLKNCGYGWINRERKLTEAQRLQNAYPQVFAPEKLGRAMKNDEGIFLFADRYDTQND
jgi:hypothetical protein